MADNTPNPNDNKDPKEGQTPNTPEGEKKPEGETTNAPAKTDESGDKKEPDKKPEGAKKPEDTPPTPPNDPDKPKPCIMCDLKPSGPGFIASCAKPKLEAYGDDVGQAQEGLKALLADKGVVADISFRWA